MHASSLKSNTRNHFYPFPNKGARLQADLAATALFNRYVRAQRALVALPLDAEHQTALQTFHDLAEVAHELHQTLMLGCHYE